MEEDGWRVIFFETARGEKIVKEFIKSLDSQTISKLSSDINLLEKHGSLLRMPYSKKLTKNLYELRTRGKQEVRIIYGFIDKEIYLLHSFLKKTQQTPIREIETANKRFKGLK